MSSVRDYLLGLATLPAAALVFLSGHGLYLWLSSTTSSECLWDDWQAVGPFQSLRARWHQRRAHGLPWLLRTRFRQGRYEGLSINYCVRRGLDTDTVRLVQRRYDAKQATSR